MTQWLRLRTSASCLPLHRGHLRFQRQIGASLGSIKRFIHANAFYFIFLTKRSQKVQAAAKKLGKTFLVRGQRSGESMGNISLIMSCLTWPFLWLAKPTTSRVLALGWPLARLTSNSGLLFWRRCPVFLFPSSHLFVWDNNSFLSLGKISKAFFLIE